MLTLGPVVFAFPWALLGLLLLPLLWRRLSATPPPPAVVVFPPVRFLREIAETQPPASTIPPWLLVLRLAILAILILMASVPRLDFDKTGKDFHWPLLIVLDDGWSAAPAWEQRIQRAIALTEAASAVGVPVHLLRLAPSVDGIPPHIEGPLPADVVIERLRALRPMPWPARPDLAINALEEVLSTLGKVHSVWLRGGVGATSEGELARRLSSLGPLTLIEGGPTPMALMSEWDAEGRLIAHLQRIGTDPETWTIEALAAGERIVGRNSVSFPEGIKSQRVVLDSFPSSVAEQVERLRIQGRPEAAVQVSLLPRTGATPLLLGTPDDLRPLTGAHWYVSRALGKTYHIGGVESLTSETRLAVLPDKGLIGDSAEAQALEAWVSAGGTLLRFAGPAVAETPVQPLLPGALRRGARALDGGLAWSLPPSPGPGEGPLEGIPAASDVTVLRHVLLQPEARPDVWIRLNDGAALVSATPFGRGRVVLIHVPSVPGWSDLPMSGLFPSLIQRIAALAEGRGMMMDPRPARLLEATDALNRPMPAGGVARTMPARDLITVPSSPEAPPGVWITADGTRVVRSLGQTLSDFSAPSVLLADRREGLDGGTPPIPLIGFLTLLVLLALCADYFAVMRLRGVSWLSSGRRGMVILLTCVVIIPGSVWAQGGEPAQILPRLAHVATGDAETDRIVALGLQRIAEETTRRTTARLDPVPVMVRPGRDPIDLYPILYWPISSTTEIDKTAAEALRTFMARGGLLVLDTRDGGMIPESRSALDRIVRNLGLPALGRLPTDHVLNQTFFLLREGQPGRFAGAPVWIVAEPDLAQDGITPIIVGSHDWALGWASDALGRPLAAFLPGGQAQRIQALRFGVNLILYAFTGNYKSDQVHVSTILDRLGQPR